MHENVEHTQVNNTSKKRQGLSKIDISFSTFDVQISTRTTLKPNFPVKFVSCNKV